VEFGDAILNMRRIYNDVILTEKQHIVGNVDGKDDGIDFDDAILIMRHLYRDITRFPAEE
jgi:hypothetical protein